MDSATQPPLDYAPARRKSRRSLWLIIACLLLSGITWVARSRRSQIATSYNSWNESRSVRRLMAYEAPSGQVSWDGVTAARVPVARAGGVAVVFLHGRTTPNGRQFLVTVEYVRGRSGQGPHLAAMIIEPGGCDALESPQRSHSSRWPTTASSLAPHHPSFTRVKRSK
jgi:hypothetical protein